MEIEYTLRPEDFRAFTRYYRKLPSGQPIFSTLAVLGVIGICLAVGLALVFAAFFFEIEGILMGVFIGTLWAALLRGWSETCIRRSRLKAQIEDPRSQWVVRDVRIVISPDQFRTVARGATSIYEWLRVWHIGVTDKHVFLCITKDTAIIVPQRAFHDHAHFEQFLNLIQQYRQGENQQVPKPTGIITNLPPQSDAFQSLNAS